MQVVWWGHCTEVSVLSCLAGAVAGSSITCGVELAAWPEGIRPCMPSVPTTRMPSGVRAGPAVLICYLYVISEFLLLSLCDFGISFVIFVWIRNFICS